MHDFYFTMLMYKMFVSEYYLYISMLQLFVEVIVYNVWDIISYVIYMIKVTLVIFIIC